MKFFGVVGLLTTLAIGLGRISAQAPAGSVRAGVYTAEQAQRGEQVYADTCASCHGSSLGGQERNPALVGPDFDAHWTKQTLADLAVRIRTMPPNQPNSLSPAAVADVMAYLLSAGGFPKSTKELSSDTGDLTRIVYEPATSVSAPSAPVAASAPATPPRTPQRSAGVAPIPAGVVAEWPTFGGNLASMRYSPLDQITKENFSKLEIAWRFKTTNFGPSPDNLYQATPLMVNGLLYITAGTRRAVVALNPATGEIRWTYSVDEGPRGQVAARNGSGRGLSFWQSADRSDQRILYVTPGLQLIALNAKNGIPVRGFGNDGVVDLKADYDQPIEPTTPGIGLNATPLVAGDVVVVGAAHNAQTNPRGIVRVKGFVRGFDVRTGKRLWTFHTIPQLGEFGRDTWEGDSADHQGNTGVWAQMSADLDLGLVYLPVEMPGNDYYGVNRPGNTLFDESLVAVDIKTGQRKWHYQTVHHGLWDFDPPCAPILFDMNVNGRVIKALAQPTKQAFLFVLNRETGEPIWPIEERPVPKSEVPGEKTSPTQPFPTKPAPFDRQGISVDDLIDFTPEIRAQAVEYAKRYRLGPLFTPPALEVPGGPLAVLMVPSDSGGANWPGGSFDPETNRLYIHSHASVFLLPNTPADIAERGPENEAGLIPKPGSPVGRPGAAGPAGRGGGRGGGGVGRAGAGGGDGGPLATVQGLPLIKPPYDQITAYDMNTGAMLWQKVHSSTPDNIKNHPALKGLDLPRTGQPGRTFIGTLVTKTLVIAGEGGVHTNANGQSVALLRAYDKATGADITAEVNLPGRQTGSPMTYAYQGRQYIVLAVTNVGANSGGELLAYALPPG